MWRRKYANKVCFNIEADLNFYDYKLGIEIDENGHSNRNIGFKIKRQKAVK